MAVQIPVARLRALCDPFTNPWDGPAFTVEDVRRAIAAGDLEATPFSETRESWDLRRHLARIAYLAVYGWDDHGVEVDVGVPFLRCYVEWPLTDGNHRLAAAIVRGDTHIAASVAGDIKYAFELFGVDICEEGFEPIEH